MAFDATPVTLPAILARPEVCGTVNLAPGVYAKVVIDNLRKPCTVTLTGGPKVSIGELQVTNSKGLRFEDLDFDVGASGYYMLRVRDSEDIRFHKVTVHGVLGGKTPPQGISFINSKGVSVTSSEFHDLTSAVAISGTDDAVVASNRMHDLGTDGIVFAAVDGLKIVGNDIYDLSPPPGAHPDAIQGLTAGTKRPSKNVLIAENFFGRLQGGPMQGVFLGVETPAFAYENVVVRDNLFVHTGYHGITNVLGVNFEVTGNELISSDGDTGRNWILLNNQTNPKVGDNKAIAITVNAQALKGGNVLNRPVAAKDVEPVIKAWRAKYRKPARLTLDEAFAPHTGASLEPLKTKGRLRVEFATPAQAQAALEALTAPR